ncbi:hypothetical protein [Mycobacteroides abscessus]|uniref:hypothetical protein n=1 Tax=Mycobacteroides abscessus TaxID=36809 RepID=UPI000C25C309|nr:hypothetical protein [Mycobacteroides abscessus]RIS77914.1 hypothetical protein D2E54_15280 [Mycobacteroides abscessus]
MTADIEDKRTITIECPDNAIGVPKDSDARVTLRPTRIQCIWVNNRTTLDGAHRAIYMLSGPRIRVDGTEGAIIHSSYYMPQEAPPSWVSDLTDPYRPPWAVTR